MFLGMHPQVSNRHESSCEFYFYWEGTAGSLMLYSVESKSQLLPLLRARRAGADAMILRSHLATPDLRYVPQEQMARDV